VPAGSLRDGPTDAFAFAVPAEIIPAMQKAKATLFRELMRSPKKWFFFINETVKLGVNELSYIMYNMKAKILITM
jgi:hypothetical protein